MRIAVGMFCLIMSWSAHSKPVIEIFFDGLERHEPALVSNAAARCAALFTVQAAVITRDAPDEEMIGQFQEAASNLQRGMLATNGMIKMKRGVEVDQEMKETLLQEVHEQTMATVEFYTDRMRANQLSTGEMWGKDELIKADMEFCPMLTRMITSDAWGNTLMTDDWSFWDENL